MNPIQEIEDTYEEVLCFSLRQTAPVFASVVSIGHYGA